MLTCSRLCIYASVLFVFLGGASCIWGVGEGEEARERQSTAAAAAMGALASAAAVTSSVLPCSCSSGQQLKQQLAAVPPKSASPAWQQQVQLWRLLFASAAAGSRSHAAGGC